MLTAPDIGAMQGEKAAMDSAKARALFGLKSFAISLTAMSLLCLTACSNSSNQTKSKSQKPATEARTEEATHPALPEQSGPSLPEQTGTEAPSPKQPSNENPLPAEKKTETRSNLFSMSTLTPTWSGPVKEDVANHRTVMYSVRACFKDLNNNSKPAIDQVFTVTLADGKTKKEVTASAKDDKAGCIDWEESIKHRYYAPEKWTRVPVAITHKNGYSVKSEYVIAPWQAWGFTQDLDAKPGFVDEINNRKPIPTRLLADAVEFNTGGNLREVYRYEVDDYLSMQLVKRVTVRIPMRAFRPSNIRDGANVSPEPIRAGKYLLKAAFVAPVKSSAENKSQMLISPMRGLTRVVEARGGEIRAELDFAVTDVRLMAARSYLVFEVKILDEEKIPKDDPLLLNSKYNAEEYVDNEAGAIMPTFVAPLFLRMEKDAGVPIPVGDLSLDLPGTDAIDLIGKRNATSNAVREAIRPFQNTSVQKLYDQAKSDRTAYRARLNQETSLGLFARRAHSDFVSIYSEPTIVAKDKTLQTNNRILQNGGKGIESLLKILNQPLAKFGSHEIDEVLKGRAPQVTRATLYDFVKGDKPFDLRLASQFCGYFFYFSPRTKLQGLKSIAMEINRGSWMDDCIQTVRNKGADQVFLRDRRIRAIEVNPIAKKIREGRTLSFQTGADFSISKSNSRSWGYGASWGSSGLLTSLSQLSLMSKLGKKMKAFTAAPGMVGAGVDISIHQNHATSTSNGMSFGSGTSLGMDQNELLIDLKKSEACVIVRPKPGFVEKGVRFKAMKLALGTAVAEELMSRGLLICDGVEQPRQVAERYYTFNSAPATGLSLDPNADDNMPWLLALRGQRDYLTFILATSSKNITLGQASKTNLDIGDIPLERLESAYKLFFAGKILSNPGYITTEPKIMMGRPPAN